MYSDYVFYSAIVKCGYASKLLEKAKKIGITGGTITITHTYSTNKILSTLGLNYERNESLIMILNKGLEEKLHEISSEFFKKYKGYCFTSNIDILRGTHIERREGKEMKSNYKALFVIVERGRGEDVIDIATENGATGATVFHGRGSGIHEKNTLFNLVIEPEKEMVMSLVREDLIEKIVDAVENKMELKKPGAGILFTIDVNDVSGLFEG